MPHISDEPIFLKLEAILEACTFQDLTGQRLRKVARLFKFLDDNGELFAPNLTTQDTLSARKGLTQEEVDRLLNSER
ncbi:MAG: Uncharacterized protein FD153_1303 [Rhodospirillaceae bacterium]|nr:MAG: Uncharacterized protein FD153_1303 [Rhodospirillaceae bacterium]